MYVISDSTAQQIRNLIGASGGTGNTVNTGTGQRQVAYVKCVTWNTTTHQGTGQVAQRDGSGWGFTGTAGDMLLLAANGEDLSVNKRYLALRFGRSGPADIFVAVANDPTPPPEVGCGLDYDEDGVLEVDAEDLAGLGLVANTTGDSCKLDINPGCAITIGDGKVNVRVEDLPASGRGLEAIGSGTCKTLAVKQGCGITVDGSGGVRVNNTALAGPGLVPVSPCALGVNPGCGIRVEDDQVKFHNAIVGQGLRKNANGCDFDVHPGCHITLEGGAKIGVDTAGLAGDGLKVGAGACPQLEVKAACGIYVDEDGVAVKNYDLAGDCLIPDPTTCLLHVDLEPASTTTFTSVNSTALGGGGCSVSLTTTSTTYTVKKNECGLIVDFVAGTPTTSTQSVSLNPMACINLGDICTYCTGYGTYGGGGTPGGTGYCWDAVGKLWVACATATPI